VGRLLARTRAASPDEEGQAVIEFALALPILALVLLGMVQLGLILNVKQSLEGVAHQAARAYAVSADARRAFDVLRIAGEPVDGFSDRSTASLVVSSEEEREVREEHHRRECRQVRSGWRGSRTVCRTLYEITSRRERAEVATIDIRGRLAQLFPPAGADPRARGKWVTVTVTYDFPNPIRASIGGFRLPETISLTTRAVARVEGPGHPAQSRAGGDGD